MPSINSGRLALVTSSLALVVAIGGTGYAASQIGTNGLKNNAVTSAKIKNNNVTGQDVKESSLAKVPSAAKADSAGSAANAGAVDGFSIAKVNYSNSAADARGHLQRRRPAASRPRARPTTSALNATTSKQDSSIFATLADARDRQRPAGQRPWRTSRSTPAHTFDLLGGSNTAQEDPALVDLRLQRRWTAPTSRASSPPTPSRAPCTARSPSADTRSHERPGPPSRGAGPFAVSVAESALDDVEEPDDRRLALVLRRLPQRAVEVQHREAVHAGPADDVRVRAARRRRGSRRRPARRGSR